jgi:hypothetical protein
MTCNGILTGSNSMILLTSSDTGREENRRGPGVPPKNWQLSDLQDHNTNEVASTKETTFDGHNFEK